MVKVRSSSDARMDGSIGDGGHEIKYPHAQPNLTFFLALEVLADLLLAALFAVLLISLFFRSFRRCRIEAGT